MENKKKVLIAVPHQDWIHCSILLSIVKILNDARYDKFVLLPPPYGFMTVESKRQYIHNFFIKKEIDGKKFDYLLSMDDDNAPLKNPLDLIELGKDIIGCVTPTWAYAKKFAGQNPIKLNAYDKYFDKKRKKWGYREHKKMKGLQEVDAIGMGCYLVARRVLEGIKEPVQSYVYNDGSSFKGEDIVFCERAKKQGFKIYAHYDYRCTHFKEIDLREMGEGYQEYYKPKK